MIVKNEEKHLERCLTSVKDVADEIVIVDTGSSDKTIEIAESFNSKIFHFNWINDFSAARNFSLSKCKSDWILYLDADEELNPDSVDEINRLKKSQPAAVYCKVISQGTNTINGSIFKYPRLFPNLPGVQFTGKVHEQIIDSLKKLKLPVIESNIEIIHYGYTTNEEELKKKKERNLSLLLSAVSQKSNVYERLKLVQTLISLNKLNEAERELNKLIKFKDLKGENRGLAFFYFASVKYEQNDLDSAFSYGLKAVQILNQKPELNYLLYLIQLRKNNLTEALQFLRSSAITNLKLLDSPMSFNNENVLDQIDLYLRAINLSYKMKDFKSAEVYLDCLSEYLSASKNIEKEIMLSELSELFLKFSDKIKTIEFVSACFNSVHMLQITDIINNCNNDCIVKNIFEQLLIKYPDSSVLYKNLALLYTDSEPLKSIFLFQKALEIEKEPQTYIHLISVYIGLNDHNKAAETFYLLKQEFSKNVQISPQINILERKLTAILT
jgi:glycosyltransferase involved in cell wall biosynthesis